MGSATFEILRRAVRLAPIVAFAFAGCTCAGPSSGPPPTATVKPSTPTVAAPATNTAPPAAAEPTAAPPAAPTEDPAAAAARSEKMTKCESFVAVLSGQSKDASLFDNADVKAMALVNPELVMCGAVATDSDDLCKRFMSVEQGPVATCLKTRAIFHELRTYPDKHTFMFTDVDWQNCRGVPAAKDFCDSLREALRSGNQADCAKVAGGDGESFCRAYMTMDKSLCTLTGKLAELEFSLPDDKGDQPTKMKIKDAAEESCRTEIENRAPLAKGLKALAESGPERERALARAALGQADACAPFATAALNGCAPGTDGGGQPPAEGAPQGGAPQGEAPKADAPAGGEEPPKPD